jgi:gas vesicle protein
MANTKSFFIGALLGGIAAGVAVALTTPKSGKEVRADLKDKSSELKESMQELLEEGKELTVKVKQVAVENKNLLLDVKADVEKSMNEWSRSTLPNREKIQEEINNIQSSIEQLEKNVTM